MLSILKKCFWTKCPFCLNLSLFVLKCPKMSNVPTCESSKFSLFLNKITLLVPETLTLYMYPCPLLSVAVLSECGGKGTYFYLALSPEVKSPLQRPGTLAILLTADGCSMHPEAVGKSGGSPPLYNHPSFTIRIILSATFKILPFLTSLIRSLSVNSFQCST